MENNNLQRSRRRGFTKEKVDVETVGRVKRPNGRCKKHPKHRQSPGVCSLCLREKLIQTQLPASAFTSKFCRRTTTFDANDVSSTSSSSYVSSLPSSYYYSSSSCAASPVHCFCCFNNNNNNNSTVTEGIKRSSFSIFLLSSRQQQHNAMVRSNSSLGVKVDNNQRETKGGFRFKLFRPKTNKESSREKMVRSMSIASGN